MARGDREEGAGCAARGGEGAGTRGEWEGRVRGGGTTDISNFLRPDDRVLTDGSATGGDGSAASDLRPDRSFLAKFWSRPGALVGEAVGGPSFPPAGALGSAGVFGTKEQA
jgi:hypothetical protein